MANTRACTDTQQLSTQPKIISTRYMKIPKTLTQKSTHYRYTQKSLLSVHALGLTTDFIDQSWTILPLLVKIPSLSKIVDFCPIAQYGG